jgi:2-isopropylmalate synthase
VEFSAEDAIRTERGFLVEALSIAAEAGAKTLNVPDTVGYSTPDEIYQLFKHLTEKVSRPDDVIFSAHCHDDLGMAVANSLAAVRGGARQIECTVNGIGERAGNCALEDAVMALRTRRDAFGLTTNVDSRQIMAASRALSKATNTHPPRNKAIVGANAFAHESGIHQHGVLKNRETYEIMRPRMWGSAPTRSCWASILASTLWPPAPPSWAGRLEGEACKPHSTPSRRWRTRSGWWIPASCLPAGIWKAGRKAMPSCGR